MNVKQILWFWLPLLFLITPIMASIYIAGQQYLRHSANFPQVTMAESGALQLAEGTSAATLVGSTTVALDASPDPFISVFDGQGRLIASTAQLDGMTPVPPLGVFDYTRANGEDMFTWQPASGVRSAAVLLHYNGNTPGFILVGRSLRQVEDLEDWFLSIIFWIWIALGLVTLLVSIFLSEKFRINITLQNRESHTI
jgi:hypothetical protein